MTDQEIVDGLINRDEKITDWFFNIKYRPLFINVIKLIFDYQVDYDECISELYYHLMKNDAAVLRNFEGRSTIGTWIKIVAIRFFREQKKRAQACAKEWEEKGCRTDIFREEPFTTSRDSIEGKYYVMVWKKGFWNQKVTIEEIR